MAEEKKPAAKTAATEQARGAWVVLKDGAVVCIESSELKGSRVAIREKADLVFWPYGKTLSEVTS